MAFCFEFELSPAPQNAQSKSSEKYLYTAVQEKILFQLTFNSWVSVNRLSNNQPCLQQVNLA